MTPKTETIQRIPLTFTDTGDIRIGDTRVALESVIHHFNLGATAEQIAHKFPALNLTDIYAVIAYYLANRSTVDDYLQQQNAKVEAAKAKLEADPEYQNWKANLRERLLAREQKAA